jgi:methionine synthase II (cobalamin-independent)
MTALPGLFPCTGVGSLPHLDPRAAVDEVLSRFREIPYWPQLPRRTPLEHMYPQFAAALPGATVLGERLTMKSGEALLPDAEAFYETFLSGDLSPFAVPAERAAGLHALLAAGVGPFPAVKGQVTGPVSFGLMVCDREKKPVFYDPVGRDVLVKYLLRVAQWQAEQLRRLSGTVILALDEPYLASVGSAIVSLPREEVIAALDEIFDGLPGVLCGIHCCANTDWGLVLASKVRYLSFDAYEYADSLLLYPEEVSAFLARGGVLAFGVVPTAREAIAAETPESLADRMEGILDRYASRGISREAMVRASVITPACGLGTLPEESAECALRLTVELSALLRTRYGETSP